jgi:hypothetical protein
MKKMVFLALMMAPFLLSAQKELDQQVVPPNVNYFDVSIMNMGFGKDVYGVTYNFNTEGNWRTVENLDNTKPYKFFSLATVLDYFDKQGFVYFMAGLGQSNTQMRWIMKRKS